MTLHRTVLWSLRVDQTRRTLTYCKDFSGTAFQQHWVAGPRGSYAVATARLYCLALVEDIELWLRAQLAAELGSLHGVGWWTALPASIQQRAAFRYKLACADFGRRRAGVPHSADWLSFGDLLKVLQALPSASWSRCLETTRQKKRGVSAVLHAIKAFRDSRLAHHQAGGPTLAEVVRLLRRVDVLCELLRPEDYGRALEARAWVKSVRGAARQLLFDLYEHPVEKPYTLRKHRLRALRPILGGPAAGAGKRDVEYYDALLTEVDPICWTA